MFNHSRFGPSNEGGRTTPLDWLISTYLPRDAQARLNTKQCPSYDSNKLEASDIVAMVLSGQ